MQTIYRSKQFWPRASLIISYIKLDSLRDKNNNALNTLLKIVF